jgi:hypothetical protein
MYRYVEKGELMKCSVVSSMNVLSSRAICLQILLAVLAAVGCTEDLPVQGPAGEAGAGTKEQGQTAADGGPSATSGAAGKSSMSTGSGGSLSSTAGKGGSGTSQSGGGGNSSGSSGSGSMTNGMSSGGSGSGSSSMSGAGSSSSMPPTVPTVKVVPACMGRAGEMVCDGAKMIKCGDMFEAAETMPCQNEARCRAGLEGGKCGACDPGIVMCTDADLYECSMAGEMMKVDTCDSPALCDEIGKKCDPAMCEMDQHKCEGGELLRCKDDLTDFAPKTSCAMELCDEAGKKCNVCMPESKVCNGSTLEVCSADGSGKQDMACPMDKPKCIKDQCLQCETSDDCKPPNECQTTMCMNGMCTAPSSKPVGTTCSSAGGKVCSLLGSCVACNTDLDCASSERCSPVFGCIERAAITVISLLPGRYTVQVNAGYGLKITGVSGESSLISFTGGGAFAEAVSTGKTVVDPLGDSTRTVTFSGPTGQQSFGGLNLNCSADVSLDSTGAKLNFADPAAVDSMGVATGMCTYASVSIGATNG